MKRVDLQGIKDFLTDYPGMSLRPRRNLELVVKGTFSFSAKSRGSEEIIDRFELEIFIPVEFPRAIPKVKVTAGKIPRDGRYHVNPDGTLCLGSPIRLLGKIAKRPTLVGFAESCLVPYLYAVSSKLKHGGGFIFNELAHGEPGIIADYLNLFDLKAPAQVIEALKLLGMKRRIANKKPCPCNCGKRLGKCLFNRRINNYRKMAPRCWFRANSF